MEKRWFKVIRLDRRNARVIVVVCSLTVTAAQVSPHPKTAPIQLAHTLGEDFSKSENWLGS